MYLRLLMLDKLIHVKTFTNEYDVEVEWDLTARCNYACSYCSSYDNTQPLLFKNIAEYEKTIDYLISYFPRKVIKIDFLGGEPTLFKDWAKLLEAVYTRGHVPKIITNLALPMKSLKSKLSDKTFKECIDVSFHPEFSNPQSFIDKVNFLYDKGFLKTGGVLMHPDYWDICMHVFNELQHTNKIGYTRIKNENNNTVSIASEFIPYSKEQEEILTAPSSVITGRFTEVTYTNRIESYKTIEDLFSNNITNFKGLNCYIGKNRLHIKANGDVYPSACLLNYPKSKMGNIYKQELKVIGNPIICPFSFCACGPDIRIEKKAI
jgi:MoaA/NifB/PqqE/SkfB family radical SAM enzyme